MLLIAYRHPPNVLRPDSPSREVQGNDRRHHSEVRALPQHGIVRSHDLNDRLIFSRITELKASGRMIHRDIAGPHE